MTDVLSLINTTGGVGIWALVAIMWRFHSRLLVIETRLSIKKEKCDQ